MDSHPQAWLPLDLSTQVRTVPRAEPDSFPEVPHPSAAPRPGLSQHGTLHRPPGHSGIVGLSPRGQLTGVTWGAAAPRYRGRERGCEARSPAPGTSGGPRRWPAPAGPPRPSPGRGFSPGPLLVICSLPSSQRGRHQHHPEWRGDRHSDPWTGAAWGAAASLVSGVGTTAANPRVTRCGPTSAPRPPGQGVDAGGAWALQRGDKMQGPQARVPGPADP